MSGERSAHDMRAMCQQILEELNGNGGQLPIQRQMNGPQRNVGQQWQQVGGLRGPQFGGPQRLDGPRDPQGPQLGGLQQDGQGFWRNGQQEQNRGNGRRVFRRASPWGRGGVNNRGANPNPDRQIRQNRPIQAPRARMDLLRQILGEIQMLRANLAPFLGPPPANGAVNAPPQQMANGGQNLLLPPPPPPPAANEVDGQEQANA